ncbi:hypothetical protein [Jannaschia aquimarina]|uniref:Uncharacterized protein n=1 Tax=Jannaschia aquimarina TaxID=935700 RepID=A0A0D1CRZ2_9RHOB|nr:hypothetical protein [Jannaschia aquimarina]KIT17572.1 hypothetical protein jaqu_07620 [Jannaschia aquimarina]SNS72520.1 hypothetical protein SAMN05421775_10244 [Jannaschia aquimarina]
MFDVDPIAMIFYAGVCAALAAYAPQQVSRLRRLMLGALVGLIAAATLPPARGLLGL